MLWLYLAGALGAAVHNPVLLIVKQAAILPAHVLFFRVLDLPKGLLHDRVLLRLNIQQQIHVQPNQSEKRGAQEFTVSTLAIRLL